MQSLLHYKLQQPGGPEDHVLMVTHQMVALCSQDKGHLSVSTSTKQSAGTKICIISTKVMNSFLQM